MGKKGVGDSMAENRFPVKDKKKTSRLTSQGRRTVRRGVEPRNGTMIAVVVGRTA